MKMKNNNFKVNANCGIIKNEIEAMNITEYDMEKAGINNEMINKWIAGEDKPTYAQLKRFSKLAGISPLMLLSDMPLSNDFDKILNSKNKSNDTLKKIKRIEYLQYIASQCYDNLSKNKYPVISRNDINDKPEFVNINELYNTYSFEETIDKINDKNIIVMQFPFNDINGFVLIEKEPYFIVINSKLKQKEKGFMLLHLYAHLLLHEKEDNHNDIEKWCDRFAKHSVDKINYSKSEKTNKIKTKYGKKFINLLMDNYDKHEIVLSDVLFYLNIKLEEFDKLMEIIY